MTSGVRTRARSYRAPGARAFAEMPCVELQQRAAPFPVTVGHDGGPGRLGPGSAVVPPLCRRERRTGGRGRSARDIAAGKGEGWRGWRVRGERISAKGSPAGRRPMDMRWFVVPAAGGCAKRSSAAARDVAPGGGAAGDGYSGCPVNPTLVKERVLSRRRLVAGTSWTVPGPPRPGTRRRCMPTI